MIPAPQPATASPTPVPLTDGCPKTHLPPNTQRFFAETIKKLALSAWDVLISIIWIKDTLREQER